MHLNTNQYLNLGITSDLLLSPDSPPERIAIAWLHIIREHPEFLAKYSFLLEPEPSLRSLVRKTLWEFSYAAGYLWRCIGGLSSEGTHWYTTEPRAKSADVLFLSHLLNPSHIGQDQDFYFGTVPRDLAKNGVSTAIALINHTNSLPRRLANQYSRYAPPRIILSNSLSIAEEICFQQRAAHEKQTLGKLVARLPKGLQRSLAARAAIETMSSTTATNLRLHQQISSLVRILQPRAIVVTFEGHAYERIAFHAARNAMPNIICIGYQHAAIFRYQHAIRRMLAPKYNPDHILTAGVVAQRQLLNSETLAGIPISVLGSPRSTKATAQLKLESSPLAYQIDTDRPACVVIPEGMESECKLLFTFTLECALALPHINFIWRLHPLISFKTLLKRNRRLHNRPPNVELSDKTLEADIGRCRWALYRGTTAVVQAVMGGLTPIYLEVCDEMTIDPLYEIEKGKFVVQTLAEFVEVVGNLSRTSDNTHHQERADLIDYCSKFYVPMDFRVLEKVIRDAPMRKPVNPPTD